MGYVEGLYRPYIFFSQQYGVVPLAISFCLAAQFFWHWQASFTLWLLGVLCCQASSCAAFSNVKISFFICATVILGNILFGRPMLPSFQLCSLFQCEDFLFHLCHCHSWQYFIWKTNAYTPFVLKRFDVKFRIRIVSEELWREEGEEKEEKKGAQLNSSDCLL